MKKREFKILILTNLVLLILINSLYLPGPNFLIAPAVLFYNIGVIGAFAGFVAVPIGLVWIGLSYFKKRKLFKPIFFTTLFLVPLLSIISLTNLCRDFSRTIAMNNGNKLVEQIEDFKTKNGNYPDSLSQSIFDIPHSGVIGIDHYNYKKTDNNFELSFNQYVFWILNFEIVTYNNRDEQKAEGRQRNLYPTNLNHWKYEIFD